MPRKGNYENTKIYEIIYLPEPNIIYIGGTTQSLIKRFWAHRHEGKTKRIPTKFYTFMNEKGIENFKIVLIEYFKCNTFNEQEEREMYWIRKRRDEGYICLNTITNDISISDYLKSRNTENKIINTKVIKYPSTNSYVFTWYDENNKVCKKTFGIDRFGGEENAKLLANEYKKIVLKEPEAKTNEEFNSLCRLFDEKHKKSVIEDYIQRQQRTKYGFIYKNTSKNYYVYKLGKTEKWFSIKKFGEEEAKQMALDYQKQIYPEIFTN